MEVIVTAHAAQRYVERVQGCSIEQARAAIHEHDPVIRKAAAFGARQVKVSKRFRLIIDGLNVVTVLGEGQLSRSVLPEAAR